MGRRDKSVLTTYGRHRNRVVATDVWSSDEDKKKHVFSFSSGGSINLSSAESDVSLLDLSKKVPVTKRKTTAKNTKNTKTQKTKGVNKENRYIKKNGGNKKGKKFAVFSETEKDSCSSTGGESLVFSVKAVNQRVLRDRNGLTDSSISTGSPASKRRTRRHKQKATNKKKDDLSYNFSEFDDYSLVVLSGTPQSANKKPKNKALTSGIETSTPFRDAKKNNHIVEKIKDPNISLIDLVEDSPFVSDLHSSLQDSPHSLSDMTGITSSYGASPSLVVSGNAAKRSVRNNSPHLSVDKNMKKLKDRDVKLLEESVQNLHISDRSWRRGDQGDASTTSALDSFQQSQSLFDSSIEARSSHLSRNVSDSSRQISPNSCVVQLQKMRDSLLRSQLSDNVFSPLRTNIHNTRSISKEIENVISGRRLRSQNVDTEGEECCPKVDMSLVDEQGGGEYSTDYSTEEDEEEEDLSDIYEDEEDEDEDEDSSAGGIDETKYSLTDNVVSGDWSVEMVSGYLSEVKEMDMSVGSLQGLQKSVYYSAESDGSFYRTAEGSSAVQQDRRVKDRKKNKHLEKTFDDGNMSRSFVEMLTPNKQSQSSPPLSPRSKLFQMCEQKAPVTFQDVIPDNMMKKIVKIGEGVYGEVFRADRSGNSVAIKIIPIEGNFEVNDEPQKTFSEILPEVVISTELSGLRLQGRNTTPNFCRVNSVACVQGRYPDHLLAQWDIYNKKRKSENDRPDIFDENQLFILFEFADGGSDLESFQFAHPWQAKSILQQVSVSLAVAEEQLEFEHRDLHIGNVLVRSNSTEDNITYRLADGVVETESHGVMVSIIDFTLSRLRKDGCTVFCDISKDDSLFEGTGDYQFDIYRNMKIENKNEWEPFNPHSNILWLHYLVDKLLKQKRYKRNSREDREAMRYLRQFQAEVLQFTSCKHLVLESHLFQT